MAPKIIGQDSSFWESLGEHLGAKIGAQEHLGAKMAPKIAKREPRELFGGV